MNCPICSSPRTNYPLELHSSTAIYRDGLSCATCDSLHTLPHGNLPGGSTYVVCLLCATALSATGTCKSQQCAEYGRSQFSFYLGGLPASPNAYGRYPLSIPNVNYGIANSHKSEPVLSKATQVREVSARDLEDLLLAEFPELNGMYKRVAMFPWDKMLDDGSGMCWEQHRFSLLSAMGWYAGQRYEIDISDMNSKSEGDSWRAYCGGEDIDPPLRSLLRQLSKKQQYILHGATMLIVLT